MAVVDFRYAPFATEVTRRCKMSRRAPKSDTCTAANCSLIRSPRRRPAEPALAARGPSDRATLRLTISLTLVGCRTGKFAGFPPPGGRGHESLTGGPDDLIGNCCLGGGV